MNRVRFYDEYGSSIGSARIIQDYFREKARSAAIASLGAISRLVISIIGEEIDWNNQHSRSRKPSINHIFT
jgi:hypothetical protein